MYLTTYNMLHVIQDGYNFLTSFMDNILDIFSYLVASQIQKGFTTFNEMYFIIFRIDYHF